jgi:penicillin-binding protein 2
VLLRHVDDVTAFEFLRRTVDAEQETEASRGQEPMPGVSVIDTGTRDYPLETMEVAVDRSSFPLPLRSDQPLTVKVNGVATHILGWMRHKVYQEDNWDENGQTRPAMLADGTPNRSLYLDGESVGQTGMERGAEAELRGLRGIQRTKLDTGETVVTPARPGKDVTLSIDVGLQARVQALLSNEAGLTVVQPWHVSSDMEDDLHHGIPQLGEPLAGSAVVIDVATGEILAMVTSPTFTRQMLKDEPETVFRDQLMMASLNRAMSQPYAAGSIVKPLILCAAVTEGKYSTTERIPCTGHYYPNQPNMLRCWTEKMFHTNHTIKFGRDLDGRDAIDGSCNIFFFEMGHRLGGEKISEWFTKFGVGSQAERWRLGLGDEYPGTVPDGKKMTNDAAILMGIGQGPMAWTPLHAADAYATLARAGVRIMPKLRKDAPTRMIDLHLDPRGVDQALAGLEAVVADDVNGTANHITVTDPATGLAKREHVFNVMELPGINVWGKSGTADASALVGRDSAGNKELLRDGDHAWCVFLVGDEGPEGPAKYAVSVVVDYGGSGGRVAGPIANQVARALVAEGYLTPRGKKDESRAAR